MIQTKDNKKLQFVPLNVVSFNDIKLNKKLINNDVYEKYEATAEISGQLIVCNDITKSKKSSKKLKKESYESYLISLQLRDPKKDEWIYNIIDGNAEQDKILYKDDKCIIIPTYIWNELDIEKMHILCLPLDKTIRTIRSLETKHIQLLNHMKETTLDVIREKYGLEKNELKIFFHYDPSTYHLHIHFVNILHKDCGSSVEYSHDFDTVLFNLSLDSDYYKKIMLNKRD
jgi:hypothetical protein